jgi:hypothetical protein|tara:strand:- start:559 stop:744 length:186 start_codon:yes stop_codon:yes gene_type:complete
MDPSSSSIASRSDSPKNLAVSTRWEEFALIAEEHFHAIKNHDDEKQKVKTKDLSGSKAQPK